MFCFECIAHIFRDFQVRILNIVVAENGNGMGANGDNSTGIGTIMSNSHISSPNTRLADMDTPWTSCDMQLK